MTTKTAQNAAIKAAGESVLDVTGRLYSRMLNSTLSGNVSMRIAGYPDTMIITPGGLDKVKISLAQLSLMRVSDETLLRGPRQSSEYHVHTRIYRAMPNINAVVHPHPPYSLAIVSAHGRSVIDALAHNKEEFDYYVGKVGIVRGRAGSEELADAVAEQVAKGCRVVIMEDHGTVGVGRTMQEALGSVEALEHIAIKYYLVSILQGAKRPTK